MKVIIYNRKSLKDKEDQQVLSIQGQKEENAKRVQQGGHEIIDEYDEEQTAKEPGRPKINEMLGRIEAGEADAIVCWRLNRLARNPIDGGRIQWLLQTGVIKTIITSEKTYTPADNVIQMAVEFGMATQYSIDLSKDVKRGMRQKVNMGWKPNRPPLGYMRDDIGLKGTKVVHVDPVRFPLVKMAWEELLSGAYSVPLIWERAVERGLTQPGSRRHPEPKPLHLSTLYKDFINPFYYGEFPWEGQMMQGKHKPMITVAEFDKAQLLLGRKGKPRPQTHVNPYACVIHCGECGAMVVMDVKHKCIKAEGIEREYRYFRCSKRRLGYKCGQRSALSQKELEKQLVRVIDDAEVPQSLIEWSLRKLKCSQEDKRNIYEQALVHLQEKERQAEAKVNNLFDLRLENPAAFTPESFERRRKALEADLKDIKKKLRDREAAAKSWRDDVYDEVKFLEGVRERYQLNLRQDRIEILRRLGQTLELKDNEVTFKLREPFSSFHEALEVIRKDIGTLEPLNCGLDKVRKDILQQAVSVWSGIRESNSRLKLGKLAYYHCTNPAEADVWYAEYGNVQIARLRLRTSPGHPAL